MTVSEQKGQSTNAITIVDVDWPSDSSAGIACLGTRQRGTAMMSEQQHYHAYMLRLWQLSNGGEPVWRISLESPHTGERHGFASLELLFAFLETQTGGQLGRKAQPHEIGER
jgi:hypothetical protein